MKYGQNDHGRPNRGRDDRDHHHRFGRPCGDRGDRQGTSWVSDGEEGTRLELPPIDGKPSTNHGPTNHLSEDMSPFEWTAFHIPAQFYSNQKRPLNRSHSPLPNYVSGRLSIFKPKITMEIGERATFAAKTRGEKSGVESGLSRSSPELRRKRRVGPLVKLWNMPHTKAIPVGIVGGAASDRKCR